MQGLGLRVSVSGVGSPCPPIPNTEAHIQLRRSHLGLSTPFRPREWHPVGFPHCSGKRIFQIGDEWRFHASVKPRHSYLGESGFSALGLEC